jgi:hypothetical protein
VAGEDLQPLLHGAFSLGHQVEIAPDLFQGHSGALQAHGHFQLRDVLLGVHPDAIFASLGVDDALLLIKPQGVGLHPKALGCLGNAVTLHCASPFQQVIKLYFKFNLSARFCQPVSPHRGASCIFIQI